MIINCKGGYKVKLDKKLILLFLMTQVLWPFRLFYSLGILSISKVDKAVVLGKTHPETEHSGLVSNVVQP